MKNKIINQKIIVHGFEYMGSLIDDAIRQLEAIKEKYRDDDSGSTYIYNDNVTLIIEIHSQYNDQADK